MNNGGSGLGVAEGAGLSPEVRALSVAMMPALATEMVCCSITSCSCRGEERREALLRFLVLPAQTSPGVRAPQGYCGLVGAEQVGEVPAGC